MNPFVHMKRKILPIDPGTTTTQVDKSIHLLYRIQDRLNQRAGGRWFEILLFQWLNLETTTISSNKPYQPHRVPNCKGRVIQFAGTTQTRRRCAHKAVSAPFARRHPRCHVVLIDRTMNDDLISIGQIKYLALTLVV